MTVLADLVRRRHSPCAEVASSLPAFVAGETELDGRIAAHVGQCLRCQAEVVRYRRMLRTLHALREVTPDPPSTVLTDILARLGAEEAEQRRMLGLAAFVAVAAGAAGGAGVIVWLTRRRPVPARWPGAVGQEMATRFSIRSATTKAMTRA